MLINSQMITTNTPLCLTLVKYILLLMFLFVLFTSPCGKCIIVIIKTFQLKLYYFVAITNSFSIRNTLLVVFIWQCRQMPVFHGACYRLLVGVIYMAYYLTMYLRVVYCDDYEHMPHPLYLSN